MSLKLSCFGTPKYLHICLLITSFPSLVAPSVPTELQTSLLLHFFWHSTSRCPPTASLCRQLSTNSCWLFLKTEKRSSDPCAAKFDCRLDVSFLLAVQDWGQISFTQARPSGAGDFIPTKACTPERRIQQSDGLFDPVPRTKRLPTTTHNII